MNCQTSDALSCFREKEPAGKFRRVSRMYRLRFLAPVPPRVQSADRPGIDWKLIIDLPVPTCEAAIEKLRWYAMRWKIEVFTRS